MFTMKERIPVSIIMTENVVKLNLKDTLSKAEELFLKHNIRHLPVVNGNHVVGILSYTDLLRVGVAEGLDEEDRVIGATIYDMYSLAQVMTKDVVTIESHTNVRKAAEILVKSGFRALPIIKDGNLVGMLTTTDLILFLLKQYD